VEEAVAVLHAYQAKVEKNEVKRENAQNNQKYMF